MGFQVMVEPPVLRDKEREGYAIRYAERREISMSYIERLEVPAGWLNTSCPELTAVDMVAYQEHIGGLTRAATVLEELSPKLDFTKLDADFLKEHLANVTYRHNVKKSSKSLLRTLRRFSYNASTGYLHHCILDVLSNVSRKMYPNE